MIEKLQAKKKLIAGVAAGVLVIGGAGYYYYAQQQSSGAEHAGHQTTTPVMAMGDVVTLDAKARQLSGLQTAQVASKALTKAIKTTGILKFGSGISAVPIFNTISITGSVI